MATTVFCPICNSPFDYKDKKRHLNLHQDDHPKKLKELKDMISIMDTSKSNSYIKTSDRANVNESKMVSSTDVLRIKKQHFMSNSTVSGGAFGQGKK